MPISRCSCAFFPNFEWKTIVNEVGSSKKNKMNPIGSNQTAEVFGSQNRLEFIVVLPKKNLFVANNLGLELHTRAQFIVHPNDKNMWYNMVQQVYPVGNRGNHSPQTMQNN